MVESQNGVACFFFVLFSFRSLSFDVYACELVQFSSVKKFATHNAKMDTAHNFPSFGKIPRQALELNENKRIFFSFVSSKYVIYKFKSRERYNSTDLVLHFVWKSKSGVIRMDTKTMKKFFIKI